MVKRILRSILVLGWIGCTGSSAQAPPAPLDVMSFNIRYGTAPDGANRWELRRDLVIDVIHDHNADVVGVQEALAFQLDELDNALPAYDRIGVGRDDGVRTGEFAAIYYKVDRFETDTSGTFWLSETPTTPGSASWGNRITRICTWARLVDTSTGAALYVFNVHLDHESQPSRERSVELVARRVMERIHEDPVVLLGDFNAGAENTAMRYLRGEIARASTSNTPVVPIRLLDTYRALHPDATETGTFGAWSGATSGDRIDAILVLKFDIVEAAIVHDNADGRYPSDHFPVTATLQWPITTR